MAGNKRAVGTFYEEKAAAFLCENGYEILEHGFFSRRGEIDLVGRDGLYLVFIEVKYRKNRESGDPAEAVNSKKQRRIREAARYYLFTHGFGEDLPCRFDVVAILGDEFRLIKDAF